MKLHCNCYQYCKLLQSETHMRNVCTSACSAVKHLYACLHHTYAMPGMLLALVADSTLTSDVVHAVVQEPCTLLQILLMYTAASTT